MAYSESIADQLGAFFKSAGIHASFEEKGGCGLFSLRLKLRCRLQQAQMLVIVREEDFSAFAQIPLNADENHRLAVAEFLTRVNFNMRSGNFELNMEDGEIRFKTYVHAGRGELDMSTIRLSTMLPFLMFDRIGDALLDVMFDIKSPREAYESMDA